MTTFNALDASGAVVALEKPLAPGPAAAAASRPVALSTEDVARVGTITETAPATDTASSGMNGRLQRIAQRITTLIGLLPASLGIKTAAGSLSVTPASDAAFALAAGTALVGKVKTKFIVASGTALTRPANQTPYTALDAISDNATAGSVTAKTITVADVNNEPVTIERLRLTTADTGIRGKAVRVFFYNSDPTANSGVGAGDNAAFSNKQAGFVGSMSGTFSAVTGAFSDGAVAVLVPDQGSRIITVPGTGAQTLWWQLQTLDDFTPSANSTTFTPTVEGFQGGAN